jgi:uncharacterized membrane protein
MKRRTIIWLVILLIVFLLFLIIKGVIGQVPHYSQATLILSTLILMILFGLYLLTSRYDIWVIGPRQVLYMGLGAALTMGTSYLFTVHLPLSFGKISLQPAVCIPILFGYAFGPGVGFFSGAVGTLLGDFAIGWDIFIIWNIAHGVSGLIPGFMSLLKKEKIPDRYLSTLVVILLALSAGMVFIHPVVPQPWTGMMENFSSWAYVLVVVGLIMFGNSYLMEQRNLRLVSINLWGALGIILSTLLASLGDIWVNSFSAGTALIGEFAPYTAVKILNLVLFSPLMMAAYHAASRRLGIKVKR